MFISVPKLLFTVLIIVAVWSLYRFMSRLHERRDHPDRPASPPRSRPVGRAVVSEDLEQCSICKVYVAPATPPLCDRDRCPYR